MSLLGKLFGTDDLKAMLQRQKTDFELQQKRQLEAFQEKEAATQAQNEQKIKILKDQIAVLSASLQEKEIGYPSLHKAIQKYQEFIDRALCGYLIKRDRPAYKAADIVRAETKKRREAEKQRDQLQCLLDYYMDILGEDEDGLQEAFDPKEYTDPLSPDDQARKFLSEGEYSSLSETDRNQLALDRYWQRKKSKRLIGKLYEQYIGYLYEQHGYEVEYFGIKKGVEDLGRDLICKGADGYFVVQCKNWSQSKIIHEKHIFQLFGTVFQFRKNHPFDIVHGVFVTATKLSELARDFAQEFDIELHENVSLKPFPIIKCHVSKDGKRIYHLPFDQQYDTTIIEPKDGDCYCMTVAEAEQKGFRRAFRWHGIKSTQSWETTLPNAFQTPTKPYF